MSSDNRKEVKREASLELLEAKLHSLADVEVPSALKAKLLNDIPAELPDLRKNPDYHWFKFWILGASVSAAALFLIGATIIVKCSSLSSPQMLIADPVEMPKYFIMMTDQNNSGLPVERVKLNEPNV
jgi:hypothetical protein